MNLSPKPIEDLHLDPNRYYLNAAQRRALWNNEISMFIVLAMPLIVASFWYGSTLQVVIGGKVTDPASLSRGVGMTVFIGLVLIIAGAIRLFIQPAAERVANAQPVRGYRRLVFAGFDALLVFLITYQTLNAPPGHGEITTWVISTVLGIAAGVIAFIAMHSMVDIPRGDDRTPLELWRAEIEDR